MQVIRLYDSDIINNNTSQHIKERKERVRKYAHLLSYDMLYCFIVDNNHINGNEIHCINKYGLIYIYNYHTKKFVTVLHPRPKQLKRYFQALNMKVPKEIKKLIDKCFIRNENSDMNNL